jgi:acyl-CoA thioesterase I
VLRIGFVANLANRALEFRPSKPVHYGAADFVEEKVLPSSEFTNISTAKISLRLYGLRSTVLPIIAAYWAMLFGAIIPHFATAQIPLHVVALGDSLTAGLRLAKDGFVPRLQGELTAQGYNVEIANAGVSGDTASNGLARLARSVPEATDAVIVELGANDMLRGIDPQVTRDALDAILAWLTEHHISIMLCGMKAVPNFGAEYGRAFERIYPELAAKYDVVLYPFFLDGVAADRTLMQPDGLHPNASGVAVIVRRILPTVRELIARVERRARRAHLIFQR